MEVFKNIQEMIGNTPIMELTHFETKKDVHIYAKLELMNPAGSVKDRVGMYMVKDAEERGLLKKGGTIVEADVPTAELFGYNTDLRSMTGGIGSFEYEFARYEQAPADVQAKEIAARAAEKDD